jgi:hypothetical protein
MDSLINPEEINEDLKNFSQNQIEEFKRIRELSISYEEYEKNVELYNSWFKSYENVC